MTHKTRQRLRGASAALSTITGDSTAYVAGAPPSLFDALTHPLSGYFIAVHGTAPRQRRTVGERAVLGRTNALLSDDWPDADTAFVDGVIALNTALAGSGGGLRTQGQAAFRTAMATTLFAAGTDPSVDTAALGRFVRDTGDPVYRAACLVAMLTNRHPFRDGNGRTARLLFNMLLQRHGLAADAYIPLSEIAERSRGGYQLWLREGETQGRWDGWFRWMANAVQLAARRRIA